MRRAVVAAIRDGRHVRFRWGLTPGRTYATEIDRQGAGAVTITALSPRSTLRVTSDDEIYVAPGAPASARG